MFQRRSMWMFSALLLGCGATPSKPGPEPAPVAPTAKESGFAGPGLSAWAATDGWTLNPDEAQLRATLKRAINPPPAADCLAREYAAQFAREGRDPSLDTIRVLNAHCGGWAPPVRTYAVSGPTLAKIEAHLTQLGLDDLDTTIGIGVVRRGETITAALTVPATALALEPIPRAPGGEAVIKGRLRQGDGQLELWVQPPSGPARQVHLDTDGTGAFSGTVRVPPEGPSVVELAVTQGRFRRSAALLTLNGPAVTPPKPARVAPLGPQDGVRRAVVERLNQARPKALAYEPRFNTQLDDWLVRIAAGRGRPEPDGLVDDRGWPYARIRYAFGEGHDGAAAAAAILATPTGRATLLGGEVDRVGVGLRAFDRGTGVDVVVVALDRFEQVPPAAARATLLDRVNATRAAAGHPPLLADDRLDVVAQGVADGALVGAVPWTQVGDRLAADLQESGAAKGGFGLGATNVAQPGDLDPEREPTLLQPGLRHVGFGVAGGLLPGDGTPRHLVLYVAVEAVTPPPAGR